MASRRYYTSKLFTENRFEVENSLKRSKSWFYSRIREIKKWNPTKQKVLKSEPNRLKSRLYPGSLYFFMYDPKTKNELPYYDRFPLVLPFEIKKGGFLGLNLHYLPIVIRMKLFDNLLDFSTSEVYNETTKIMMSWSAVKNVSRFKAVKPCIKRYLSSHVRSPYRKIPSQDWISALLLPVQDFNKKDYSYVWSQSRSMIK